MKILDSFPGGRGSLPEEWFSGQAIQLEEGADYPEGKLTSIRTRFSNGCAARGGYARTKSVEGGVIVQMTKTPNRVAKKAPSAPHAEDQQIPGTEETSPF